MHASGIEQKAVSKHIRYRREDFTTKYARVESFTRDLCYNPYYSRFAPNVTRGIVQLAGKKVPQFFGIYKFLSCRGSRLRFLLVDLIVANPLHIAVLAAIWIQSGGGISTIPRGRGEGSAGWGSDCQKRCSPARGEYHVRWFFNNLMWCVEEKMG